MDRKNRVYWLTGLSGAGKTTIGRLWYEELKKSGEKVVLLDGDELRAVFGGGFGFTAEARLKLGMSYGRLCALLAAQGFTVVCCTISMFHSVRAWNRANIPGYYELCQRDQKGLYSRNAENVAGVGLQVEMPSTPDLILDNNGQSTPEEQVALLCRAAKEGV